MTEERVRDVNVDLGPRMIWVGNKAMGTADNLSMAIGEATKEELEELQGANEIRLVKIRGEE